MAAKIDIDACKLKKKSRTNEAENRQKIKKHPVSTQDLLVLKKKSVLRLVHFSKKVKLKINVHNKFTHQQPQGCFALLNKIIV